MDTERFEEFENFEFFGEMEEDTAFWHTEEGIVGSFGEQTRSKIDMDSSFIEGGIEEDSDSEESF